MKVMIYFLQLDFNNLSKSGLNRLINQNSISHEINIHSSRKYIGDLSKEYPCLHAYTDVNSSGRSGSNSGSENLKKNINFLDKDQINIQDKVFYRTPKLDLPTMKVDLIKDKYGVSVKRDFAKADYVITSHKFIESLIESSWSKVYPANALKEHLDSRKAYFTEHAWIKIEDFFNSLNSGVDFVKFDNNCSYSNNQGSSVKSNVQIKHSHAISDIGVYPGYITNLDMIKRLQDPNNKIVLDSTIIKICNEDSVVLKVSEVKSIVSMLKSQDSTNHSLALEMMANCNIDKSFDKIALLFAFYANTLRYASNWNHVNVKSLRQAMKGIPEMDPNNVHTYAYSNLVKLLHEKNILTPFAVKAIQKKMMSAILTRIGLSHESSAFDLKYSDIKIKEEYSVSDDLPF